MNSRHRSLFPGIALISVGLWFAFRNNDFMFHIWSNLYPVLILLLAGILLFDAEKTRSGSSLFWGTGLFIISAFFILNNYDIIPHFYIEEYWPIFPFAAGMGWLILFIAKPDNRGSIIPAIIFLFIGLSNGLDSFGIVKFNFDEILSSYWPVGLVIIGVSLIVKSLLTKSDQEK